MFANYLYFVCGRFLMYTLSIWCGNKSGTSYVLSGQRKENNIRVYVLKSRVELDRLCVVGYVVLSDFVFCSESS